MTPKEVATVPYVPADTIMQSRDTVSAEMLAVIAFAVFVLLALLMVWRMNRDRRAIRHVRKQSDGIGVAAVGLAVRMKERTR